MTTLPPIRLPSGVRDFLPRAAARRRDLAEKVMSVFDSWGYARVITPMFELADVLERGMGEGAKAAAIRFVEPGSGQIVALRPDITPQIARIVATRLAEVPGPIRLCYEGAVTRLADEGQREILQAGIELIDASDAGDAEVLAVASAVLDRLQLDEPGSPRRGSAAEGQPGVTDAHLDIGHVAPARYVLGAAPNQAARRALVAAISRKDRAGVRVAARALPEAIAPLANELVHLWGPVPATLERARTSAWPDSVHAAFAQIEHTLAALAELATPRSLTIDLGDLRGFDYYTGMRFAAFATGAPEAILRGGRYDELIGRYGRPARATGFAIDLESVAQAQRANSVAAPSATLGVATNDRALARAMRAAGVRCVVQDHADPTWLAGAGLDAAIVGDSVIFATDRTESAAAAIQAARAGDTAQLIALLKA